MGRWAMSTAKFTGLGDKIYIEWVTGVKSRNRLAGLIVYLCYKCNLLWYERI